MDNIHCNEAELEGLVLTAPAFSHENHGTVFYRFVLEVPRLSGQADRLPVLVTAAQLPMVTAGQRLRIAGQLRSFNNRSGQGSRLVLSVYARTVQPPAGEAVNRIRLSGALCKPPILRRTPLGRSICDLMLAVPRRYGRADYLPVIAWGQLAGDLSRRAVGETVALEGRIQSRQYTKVTDGGPEERTAYEVSIMHLEEPEKG
ncbi:single-stranded DNA-binding protein [Dysosmobacter sp.]|uniref:single-stranded DNA-binding protein n=1 Tax=Dysosmobacter sp. TaxID=2591382 RepID=UPI002A8C7326|nr:single-stranded DNA-binding protein [Dysosmobacter sp.]MDY3281583.1 single-stranded DNA-binding protein [Dysosmobacter sp.]